MKKRRWPLLAAGMIVWLAGCSSDRPAATQGENILIRFDHADYERMNQFAERFRQGKNDYVMAIPKTIEGGPIIYDIRSYEGVITVKIDHSRDAYGAAPEQAEYDCRGIGWRREEGKTRLTLSSCEGIEGDWSPLSFEK